MSAPPVLGFIGLGRMGGPMARNLAAAGHPLVVYDIDAAKRQALADRGAQVADSPAEVAARSDVSFSIIMNDAVLHDVVIGRDGVIAGARSGHMFCDLSTVSPAASAEIATALAPTGVTYLRGKVAGSIALAEEGTLTIFASGNSDDFVVARPFLEVMGQQVIYVGPEDVAHYLKLVHSAIVGVYAALVSEALAFGEKGGVGFDQMLDILTGGPLDSVQLSLKAPMLKAREFDDPPSDIDTAAKDLDLVLAAARGAAVPMPLTAAVRQIMSQQQAAGAGKKDIWSMLELFESMAAVHTPKDSS